MPYNPKYRSGYNTRQNKVTHSYTNLKNNTLSEGDLTEGPLTESISDAPAQESNPETVPESTTAYPVKETYSGSGRRLYEMSDGSFVDADWWDAYESGAIKETPMTSEQDAAKQNLAGSAGTAGGVGVNMATGGSIGTAGPAAAVIQFYGPSYYKYGKKLLDDDLGEPDDVLKAAALTNPVTSWAVPIMDSFGIETGWHAGKHPDQKRRDMVRADLQNRGFVGEDWTIETAKGNKVNIGLDGDTKPDYAGGYNAYQINADNPLAQQALHWAMPLAYALTGGDEKLAADFTGYIANAAMSDANNVEELRNNFIKFYQDNVSQDGDMATLREDLLITFGALLQDGKITQEQHDSFVHSVNSAYQGNPENYLPGGPIEIDEEMRNEYKGEVNEVGVVDAEGNPVLPSVVNEASPVLPEEEEVVEPGYAPPETEEPVNEKGVQPVMRSVIRPISSVPQTQNPVLKTQEQVTSTGANAPTYDTPPIREGGAAGVNENGLTAYEQQYLDLMREKKDEEIELQRELAAESRRSALRQNLLNNLRSYGQSQTSAGPQPGAFFQPADIQAYLNLGRR